MDQNIRTKQDVVALSTGMSNQLEFCFLFKPHELKYLPGQSVAHHRSPCKQYNDLDWYVGVICNTQEDSVALYFMNKQVEEGVPLIHWGDYEYCFTLGEGVKEMKINVSASAVGSSINSMSSALFNCRVPHMTYLLNEEGEIKVVLEVRIKRFICHQIGIPPLEDSDSVQLKLDCGKHLYVSKSRLCKHSPFFDNLIKHTQFADDAPKIYHLPDVKYLSLCLILHMMYGMDVFPCLFATTDQIFETLTLCDRWLYEPGIRALETGIMKTILPDYHVFLPIADRFRMFSLVDSITAMLTTEQLKKIDLSSYSLETLRAMSRAMQYRM
uniref:BTB domain-containing protein n=1 Tax=Steinernema glaseri TaxID=37863 RepID=A0A1I7ZMF0_9BILA